VKHLIEPPFIYVYHTLRYISDLYNENGHWSTEHLAVQVLSTSATFRIPVPVMQIESLGAGQQTEMKTCLPIGLDNASACALTVECDYASQAKAGLRVHVRSSYDGIIYDSQDLYTFDFEASAGEAACRTVELEAKAHYLKVVCENLDEASDVSQLRVTATIVG